jgi:hypothetical protein
MWPTLMSWNEYLHNRDRPESDAGPVEGAYSNTAGNVGTEAAYQQVRRINHPHYGTCTHKPVTSLENIYILIFLKWYNT